MKNLIQKFISRTAVTVLSLLGFSSCEEILSLNRCEYGTPYGEFKVDLTVKDESGAPIKDIKVSPVVIHPSNYDIKREELDAIKSDASGKATNIYDHWWLSDVVRVIFEDTDGDLNGGSFVKDSMDFKPVQTKKGDKHWYVGEKTISGTATLKKK